MIVTTTSDVQGRRIVEYHSLVTGEAILGANAVRDFFASIRDVVGGRPGAYEKVLKSARDSAVEEMIAEASARGGRCGGRGRSRLRGVGQGGRHAHGRGQRHGGEAGLTARASSEPCSPCGYVLI